MPQLVKGGKWVFGWVIVGPRRELTIPPAAWEEYRFQVGDEVTFIPGSQRSGGFGLSHARLLADMPAPLQMRALAKGRIDEAGQVVIPDEVGMQPDDQLLVVRGSGRALGFVTRGPIYEEALKHPGLPVIKHGRIPGGREGVTMKKVCIVGASGKLGKYMVQHALDRVYEVVGVCRERSVGKLDEFKGRITVVPGATNDREVIKKAVAGCDGVLTVLVPWGVQQYSSGTAQAVLDYAPPGARLVFSCGWHITRDGKDVYSRRSEWAVRVTGWLGRLFRVVEIDDQVEACRRIFASDTLWTVVRGSDLEEGESQGLPVWSRHVGDPILESNLTRRVDFALFMVEALENDELIHEAPAIVGCQTPSALAHQP